MIVGRQETPQNGREEEDGWFYWDEYDLERLTMQIEEGVWEEEISRSSARIIPFPTLRPPRKKTGKK